VSHSRFPVLETRMIAGSRPKILFR
jgi:hypothetical protein